MSVQKAIFPGLFLGIILMLVMVSIFTSPGRVSARNQAAVAEVQEVLEAPVAKEADANIYIDPAMPADGNCSINSSYPESVRQWCGLIEHYANENGVDPNLISAVMLQESGGKPDAYSKSGAVGLLQVMPRDGLATKFMCKNGPCFSDRPSMEELFDPKYNVAYGTQMLAELIQYYGDVREALKAYGPKDVGYYYADIVLGIMNRYD